MALQKSIFKTMPSNAKLLWRLLFITVTINSYNYHNEVSAEGNTDKTDNEVMIADVT